MAANTPPNDQFNAWLEQQQNNLAIQGNNEQLTDAQINQLRQQWSAVPPAQQAAVLKALQSNTSIAGTQQIMAALTSAQRTAQASTPTSPTASSELLGPSGSVSTSSVGSGSTPVEGTSQATALIKQYMSTPLWQGDPNDPQGAAQGLGIDFASADTQYQQYAAQFKQATQRRPNPQQAMPQPMSEVAFIQGLAQSSYGQWGPVIGMLAYEWQEQNGTPMPADLAQQIIAGLKQIPANDAAQLQTQMLNSVEQISQAAKNATASGGQSTDLNLNITISSFLSQLGTYAPSVFSGGASGTGSSLADSSPNSIVGQYTTAHPAAAGIEAAQKGSETTNAVDFLSNYNMPVTPANIAALSNPQTYANMGAYVSWMQGVGMPITAAALESLMTMPFSNPATAQAPAGTGGAMLLDQMVPGTHMTYGAYQEVSSQITPQWEQYFNGQPTKAQLAYFVGKSSEDITDYFNNSSSSIPGITIGQKNDYESFINGLDQQSPSVAGINHTFSSQVDDSMMNELHQAVTAQSTGTPKPGPMK
jgi:hypothetical protein